MEEIIEKDMTPILLEDLGMRFATEKSKHKRRFGLYQCQYCGKKFETQTPNIKFGNTNSCGCQAKTNRKTHGLNSHPLYKTWSNMIHRCSDLNFKQYEDYGGRGIMVCDEWKDIRNFIDWVENTSNWEEGLTLDRIDTNGNYEPDNCRWTTNEVQNRNCRQLRITNTSGFRGVSYYKKYNKWVAYIYVNKKRIQLGYYTTALEAAKAYERYVRLNNLEHNFTPVLTEEEIEDLNIKIERK